MAPWPLSLLALLFLALMAPFLAATSAIVLQPSVLPPVVRELALARGAAEN